MMAADCEIHFHPLKKFRHAGCDWISLLWLDARCWVYRYRWCISLVYLDSLAHIDRRNLQRFPIFGDGSPRHNDTLFSQYLRNTTI